MDTLTSLSELVKHIRHSKRLSQADLARHIGVNKDVISKVEAGRTSEGVALRLIIAGLASPTDVATAMKLSGILVTFNPWSFFLAVSRKVANDLQIDFPVSLEAIPSIEQLKQLLAKLPDNKQGALATLLILNAYAVGVSNTVSPEALEQPLRKTTAESSLPASEDRRAADELPKHTPNE